MRGGEWGGGWRRGEERVRGEGERRGEERSR